MRLLTDTRSRDRPNPSSSIVSPVRVRLGLFTPGPQSQEAAPEPMEPIWAQPIENSWRNPRLRFQGGYPENREPPVHPSLPAADLDDLFRTFNPVQPSNIPTKKTSAHRKRREMLKAQGAGLQLTTANVHRHNLFQTKRGKRRREDNDSIVTNSATSSRSSKKSKAKSKSKEREVLCYRPKPEIAAAAKELAEYDVIQKDDINMDDAESWVGA